MADRNDGGPAFPDPARAGGHPMDTGMSLRDAAALDCAKGMLAHSTRYRPRPEDAHMHWHDALMTEAFDLADAFIRARGK